MTDALEALLVRGVAGWATTAPGAFRRGAALGDWARSLGLRRRVAEENLARAFPEKSASERRAILVEHYHELGRVAWEYPRLAALVRAKEREVVAEVRGVEHLEWARSLGRGVILLTGHYGNFELLGAWLGQRHPTDFLVKPLSNPRVEAMLAQWRQDAGIGSIPIGVGARRVFKALAQNRWVAMLADQDARRSGVFVPFFGTPASTPIGPAEIALRTGAPIVMGFGSRRPDGRHELDIQPPLAMPEGTGAAAVRALTAAHTAALEAWIRRQPEMWFWLHRRWKTTPPANEG
jgi:Kdo2-lipid IVA lauroyltransferase/acyltransferase